MIESLPTPALLLDVARARTNAARIGDRVRALGARLRPHVKTHKCIEVARLQVAGHSGAITVSTLAEARAFAAHGFHDITYAVPIEPGKFAAVNEVYARVLGEHRPARAIVPTKALHHGFLVEMDAVAVTRA